MLAKSSTGLVRLNNRALVLSALRRGGPMSHTDIAEITGLASATVSAITGELEQQSILERAEIKTVSGRGRPRILFRHRRESGYLALVRISSGAVQYSLADYAGTLVDRFDEERPRRGGGPAFTAMLLAALARLVERSGLSRRQVLAISISSKGLVARAAPVLLWSPVLGDERIDFEAALAPAWSARVTLSHETLLVATALHQRLSGKADGPGIKALSLGHSIGLGIVLTGADGALQSHAPNFGHMLHQPGGALCRCGARGCIEAYAGFYAILRTAFEVPPETLPADFVPVGEVEKIAALARRGDRMAGYAFRQAGSALGHGLARVISLYQRMPIAITGPGVQFYDLMREGLEEGLTQSLSVRIEGPPTIRVVHDEESLVFDGNLRQTLERLDNEVFAGRTAAQGGT